MNKKRSEGGQALVTVAFSVVVLIGFMGLALDMGYLRYAKRRMQSASDSAAIAGAAELPFGDSATAAKRDAGKNGYTDGTDNVTVTVGTPTSGPHNGDANYVEVIVSQNQPTFFMKIFGTSSVPMSARAVGTLGSSRGPIYALGAGKDSINTNGESVDVDVPNGSITGNGNLAGGDGGSIIASSIGVAGSVSAAGTSISPNPQTGIVPINDPLSTLPTPSVGGCDFRNLTINGNATLTPGTYCGLAIQGPNGGGGGDEGDEGGGSITVHFNPGVYVLTGGIAVSGNVTLTGTDVTFYITGGSVGIDGAANNEVVDLVAPTSGTYSGILFFQDSGDSSAAIVTGADGSTIEGALYFPKAQVTTNGGGSAAYTIVVADTVVFEGNRDSTFNNNFSKLANGSPVKSPVLAE